MSISLYWNPLTNHERIKNASSSEASILRETFGKFPIYLGERNLTELRAMARVYTGDPNPYQQLVEAIESHRSIVVTMEG